MLGGRFFTTGWFATLGFAISLGNHIGLSCILKAQNIRVQVVECHATAARNCGGLIQEHSPVTLVREARVQIRQVKSHPMAFELSFVSLSSLYKKHADYALTTRLYQSGLGRGDARRLWRLQDDSGCSCKKKTTRCIDSMIERKGHWEAMGNMLGVTFTRDVNFDMVVIRHDTLSYDISSTSDYESVMKCIHETARQRKGYPL